MAEYVYGVIETKDGAPAGAGIGGAPLDLVAGDGAVAALVSELPGVELRLGREEVLTHARVLSDAIATGTVLPMRFGVVMDGAAEVRDRLLDAHAPELSEQLHRLAGKVEINIRAMYEEEALMREVIQANPDIARLRESGQGRPDDATYYERIRLGELVAKAIERKREADARDVVDALSQLAAEVQVAPPAHERIVVSAAFLVERAQLSEFDAVVEAFAEGQAGRMRFKYTGPLAPHSFVELSGVE
jgi:hypothetical protein